MLLFVFFSQSVQGSIIVHVRHCLPELRNHVIWHFVFIEHDVAVVAANRRADHFDVS